MRRQFSLANLAMIGAALGGLAGQAHHSAQAMMRLSAGTGPRVKTRPANPPFHPTINRWTGRPHEHKREIARRLRQGGAQ